MTNEQNTAISGIRELLNCRILDYNKAKEFKPLFNLYCRENQTNRMSLKWLKGLNEQERRTRTNRINLILTANDLILLKEQTPFYYLRRRNHTRRFEREVRFKVNAYITERGGFKND